jgi:hypothetical protein
MGPHGLRPYSEAGGAPDYVAEMNKLVKAHPTLTWIPGFTHTATWDDDDGQHREQRERLSDLVEYLRAKLGQP